MTLKADVAALISESVRKAKSSLPNFAVARKLGLDDAERLGLAGVDSMFARLSPPAVELFDTIWGLISVPLTSQESTVDDEAFALALCERQLAQPHLMQAGFGGGSILQLFKTIVLTLKANGVTWPKIIALLSQILLMITTGGGNWSAIWSAIWALFFPVNPPPLPPIQFPA